MKLLIPIITLLSLTACTSYKEGFDCEALPGVGCRSISEVDKMIDEGKLGGEEAENKPTHSSHQPKSVHVWIAPYSDNDGIMHGSQSLFVPLNPKPEGTE